jgi:prepilin-type N-terminal cleavage/methylation domain-containing protein
MSRKDGYSVIELLIAVVIIADLALIAVPFIFRARQAAQNSQFLNDLRICVSAVEMFAAENTRYPTEADAGVVPTGLAIYLHKLRWSQANSLNGSWDWDYQANGLNAAVSVVLPAEDDVRLQEIDERMDNGALVTGAFRKTGATRYSYIVE